MHAFLIGTCCIRRGRWEAIAQLRWASLSTFVGWFNQNSLFSFMQIYFNMQFLDLPPPSRISHVDILGTVVALVHKPLGVLNPSQVALSRSYHEPPSALVSVSAEHVQIWNILQS